MELFFAQNHAPMTHLPIASAILAVVALVLARLFKRPEAEWMWAVLSITVFITIIPAAATGIHAARGREYIEADHYLVRDSPDLGDLRTHQQLGIAGTVLALAAAILGARHLRRKRVPKLISFVVALALATVLGIGGHLGGKELWSPATFPAYETLMEEDAP